MTNQISDKDQADFRIYSPEAREAIVEAISTYTAILPDHQLSNQIDLESLLFRDSTGHYWIPELIEKKWLRFSGETWTLAENPKEHLQGSDSLQAYMTVSEDNDLKINEDQGEPDSPPSPAEIKKSLQKMISDTWKKYLAGLLTSNATNSTLQQCMIPDKNGTIWTVGCHSSRWYCFTEDDWQTDSEPPDDLILSSPQDLEEINEKLNQTLVLIFQKEPSILPEAIIKPWTPPPILPESLTRPAAICPFCGARATAKAHFCPQCGNHLPTIPDKQHCSKCGQELPKNTRFCTNCGTAVI